MEEERAKRAVRLEFIGIVSREVIVSGIALGSLLCLLHSCVAHLSTRTDVDSGGPFQKIRIEQGSWVR